MEQNLLTGAIFFTAYLGGILMIFAPCTFALLPAYLGNTFSFPGKVLKRTLAFFGGFALVFVPLWFTATLVGKILNLYLPQFIFAAGIFLISLGILTIFARRFPSFIKRFPEIENPYWRSFFFGLFFALGFSGCSGPVLVAILATSATLPQSVSFLLMLAFTAGVFTPLFLLSVLGERFKIPKIKFLAQRGNLLAGALILILGVIFLLFKGTEILTQKYPAFLVQFGNDLQRRILSLQIPLFWEIIGFVLLVFLFLKLGEKRLARGLYLKINLRVLNQALVFFLSFLLILNFALVTFLNLEFRKQQKIAAEASRPANLEVTQILAPNCPTCLATQTFLDSLKKQNVKIEKEGKLNFGEEASQNLIKQSSIERLPALVIRGEIEKGGLPKFFAAKGKIQNEAFIFESPPPYFDLKLGKIIGEVTTLTLLTDSTCSECYPVSRHEQILASFGIRPVKTETLDLASPSGRQLLNRYNITLLPTFILNGDLSPYAGLNQVWPQVGTKERDGTYVFREGVKQMGVYKNLFTGQVVKPTPPPTPTPPPAGGPTTTPTPMPGSSLEFEVK